MQKIKQFEMDDARGIYFRAVEGSAVEQVIASFLDNHTSDNLFAVRDKLKNVVSKVRTKDPNYTFVVDSDWSADYWRNRVSQYDKHPVTRLWVFYKDERCGKLTTNKDYLGDSRSSLIVRSRLTESESRKGTKESSKEDVIVKNIFKYIQPLAVKERMESLYHKVATAIRQAMDNADTEHLRSLRSYHPFAGQVIDNLLEQGPDMVRKVLPKNWTAEKVEKFFDGLESSESIKKMQQAMEANKGMLVLKHKGDIYLSQPHTHLFSCATRRLKHERLSDTTKQHIAMLTLAEPNTVVTTVGVRVDDDKFYLQDDNGDLYGER